MKRLVTLAATLVLALALAGFLAGCGGSGTANVQLNPGDLADKLFNGVKFDDQLTALDMDGGMAVYGLDATAVADCKVYVGTGGYADEIAVWQAKDAAAAKVIFDAVNTRVSDQKEAFKDYQPREMPKLESPLVRQVEGGQHYVILCLSPDIDSAKAIIDQAIKDGQK